MLLKMMFCTNTVIYCAITFKEIILKLKNSSNIVIESSDIQVFFVVHDALDTNLQHTNSGSNPLVYNRTLRNLFGCW